MCIFSAFYLNEIVYNSFILHCPIKKKTVVELKMQLCIVMSYLSDCDMIVSEFEP